mgnify:CR=1 FL=1
MGCIMNKIKIVFLFTSIFFEFALSASMRPVSPIRKSYTCSACKKFIANGEKSSVDYMLIRIGDGIESKIVKCQFISSEPVVLDKNEKVPSTTVLAHVFTWENNLSNFFDREITVSMLAFGNSNNQQQLIQTYYFGQTPDLW